MLTKTALAGLLAASVVSADSFKLIPVNRRASDEVTAKGFAASPGDRDSQQWAVEAEIGGQKLILEADTGSSDLYEPNNFEP